MRGTVSARVAAAVCLLGVIAIDAGCGGGYGGGGKNYGNAPSELVMGASLLGSEETTVVNASARGSAVVHVKNDGTLAFAVTGEASWIGEVTGIAIHKAFAGINGPQSADLLAASAGFDGLTRTAQGSTNVGSTLATDLINYPDYYYVQVETSSAPGGLVRGQLAAGVVGVHALLRGSEEAIVVDATARGAVSLSVGSGLVVHWVVATANPAPSAITFALLERGGLGVDGPVELDLGSAAGVVAAAAGTITGDVVAPISLLSRLAQDLSQFHVNLHATGAASGISRGQLTTASEGAWGTLAGSNEVVVVDAAARGGVTLQLDSFTTGRAIYAVPPAQDVTLVTGARVRIGGSGVIGPDAIDLRAGADFTTEATSGTAEGAIVLDQTIYTRLLSNPAALYAEFVTAAAPFGLARGQLTRSAATFAATLLGTNELTVVDPTASGAVKFLLTDIHEGSCDLTMTTPAASSLVGAHIHQGPSSVNGPIVVDFLDGTNVVLVGNRITGACDVSGRIGASILAAPELFYSGVHRAAVPDRLARGQFARIPDTTKPTGLTYTSPAIYLTATPITPNTPTSTGGAVETYTISPALSAGLSIDPTTGVISGTPTATRPLTVYTVTATNSIGFAQANVTITVNVALPAGLAYTTPVTYIANSPINHNNPTSTGGAIATYSTSGLPPGLSVDPVQGFISGTPTTVAAAADFQITGTNASGFTTATVRITIDSSLTAPVISYSSPSPTYSSGYAISPNTVSNTGGDTSGTTNPFSVSPALPTGLTLNTTTGAITGTPLNPQSATAYTVTATNAAGSGNTTVTITVVLGAPSNFTYTNTPQYAYRTPNGFYTMTPQGLQGGSPGNPPTFSINPSLPAGINLNADGTISGTPTAASPGTTYTVTATNGAGSGTATIYIYVY